MRVPKGARMSVARDIISQIIFIFIRIRRVQSDGTGLQ